MVYALLFTRYFLTRHFLLTSLLILVLFLLPRAFAQVTYSKTPTQEELEQYFVGGLQILEVPIETDEEVRYQLINMKTMGTVWSGATGNLESGEIEEATVRFALSVIDFFADNCAFTEEQSASDVSHELVSHRLSLLSRETMEIIEQGGGGQCLQFDSNFNLGHWTNILAEYDAPLPKEGWIPATAFIPNFYDGELTYGSAETWLVLLITFDDLDYGANPNELSQEQVIELLQDYGLDTTP
ncbi:MAG: hypothetical protein ACRCYY_13690 [Trueperaceae bacterium]